MILLNFKTPPQTVAAPAVKVPASVGSRFWQRRRIVTLALSAVLCATSAAAQNVQVQGSTPRGPASNEVLPLTLRDAIKMALRYNLDSIESGENAQIARGQRLVALSRLLPQVSIGASESVDHDFDRTPREDFNAEGSLKPGLSVVPDVRVR